MFFVVYTVLPLPYIFYLYSVQLPCPCFMYLAYLVYDRHMLGISIPMHMSVHDSSMWIYLNGTIISWVVILIHTNSVNVLGYGFPSLFSDSFHSVAVYSPFFDRQCVKLKLVINYMNVLWIWRPFDAYYLASIYHTAAYVLSCVWTCVRDVVFWHFFRIIHPYMCVYTYI